MQGNSDSFVKSQKKNRRWDDGTTKQGNSKKQQKSYPKRNPQK